MAADPRWPLGASRTAPGDFQRWRSGYSKPPALPSLPDDLPRVAAFFKRVMEVERPKVMPGFVPGVDIEVGPNWGELKEWSEDGQTT